MEASENIPPRDPGQLAFEPPPGSVRALGDRLVIESLTVTDETAARVVRERAEAGQQPSEAVGKMVEIGARVLDREETAADLDYVRRAVEDNIGQVGVALEGALDQGTEALTLAIAEAFGSDRADSVQAQIKEIVGNATGQQREALISLLTTDGPANPLHGVQSRLVTKIAESEVRHRQELERTREAYTKHQQITQAQVAELTKEITRLTERGDADERVAEAEAAGTRKGFSFEERVHEAIERIASTRGDCAHHTGGEAAEGGGKKGDSLVEIGAASGPANGRIVFEAKDKRLSGPKAWEELDGCIAARAASFGVLVVAGEENLPPGREPLTEYQGNKLIIAVDRDEPDGLALELAYRLAAARVSMRREGDLEVDAVAVRDAAEEAIATLQQTRAMKQTLTSIKTNADKVYAGLETMATSVREKLEQIDSLVAEAASEETGDD